jgi:hypothetical protein
MVLLLKLVLVPALLALASGVSRGSPLPPVAGAPQGRLAE